MTSHPRIGLQKVFGHPTPATALQTSYAVNPAMVFLNTYANTSILWPIIIFLASHPAVVIYGYISSLEPFTLLNTFKLKDLECIYAILPVLRLSIVFGIPSQPRTSKMHI